MVLLRDFSRFPFFAVHLCRSGKPSVTARAMNGTSRHQRQANRKNAVSDDPNEFEPTDTAYFFVYVCPVSHFRHGSLFLLAVSFRYGFSLGIFISICLCFRLPPFSRLSVGTHQVVILVLGAKVIPGLDGKARSSRPMRQKDALKKMSDKREAYKDRNSTPSALESALKTKNQNDSDMTAKRRNKTAAQQCRYYEVGNIFEYMVETYINGNISVFRELYHELNKDARKDFIDFLLSEVEPTYWREILKQTI